MATNVIMPSQGFDMTEGKLVHWLAKEGERVEKGRPIAEIETEKAAVEIESPASGILHTILVHEDQTLPVGTVIGVIADPGEKLSTSPPAIAPVQAISPPAVSTTVPPPSPSQGRIKATPIARKMADEAGIDLSQIKGTGPDGRIVERDIQAAKATLPPATVVSTQRMALSGMRKAIARRMTESKSTTPHFYVSVEINMSEALKLREQLNALAPVGGQITVNDLVVASSARALTKFPVFNSSYRDGGLEHHAQINIGIAVAVNDGLLTPVLHDADKKPLNAIAAESRDLGDRARAQKVRSDDLGGGTFTVSNLGMYGADEFFAIINPPEAAILAVGRIARRPIAAGEAILIAPMMKVVLSVDHRVADGVQAAAFLQEFRKLLEEPANLLMPDTA